MKIGAGGFVTGISFSDDGRTRVIRTDTFGGYRWSGAQWRLNVSSSSLPAGSVSPGTGDGVLAVAVAPSRSSRVYMAYEDAVYRSDDGGRKWVTSLREVTTAPNDDFRTTGSRLAVDPHDPDTVYYGSQVDGLRITVDGGRSWRRVGKAQMPYGLLVDVKDSARRGDVRRPTYVSSLGTRLGGAGINAIAIDRSSRVSQGRHQTVYAAVHGYGVYRSGDAGRSWSKISPQSVKSVSYLRVLSNGNVLLTSHPVATDLKSPSDVWRVQRGRWTRLSLPKSDNWRAIAEDPTRPGTVAAMAPGGRFALSRDFGRSWQSLPRSQSSANDVPWLAWALNGGTNWMGVGEIAFDPVRSGRLWLTEGTGVWYADLGGRPSAVHWRAQSRGIEQLVGTDVVSPPGGKPVMTAWDRPIFRSEDPRVYPTHYGPVNRFGSAWSVDWSGADPDYLVADVASHQWPSDPSDSGFSTDGGRTWKPFPSIPYNSRNAVTTFGFGTMAAGKPGNVVWVPSFGKRPHFTLDGGRSWKPITLPGVTDYSVINRTPYFIRREVLAADRAAPGTFYLYVQKVGLFRSVDGGSTWAQRSDNSGFAGTDTAWHVRLEAVPGSRGELFMTPGRLAGVTTQPFAHSTDGGRSWSDVRGVTGVTAFGFGKAFPGSEHATLYIAGYVQGRYGIYRSTDNARSFTRLGTYPAGRTATVQALDGDKDVVGRLYLSIAGGGWVFGELRATSQQGSTPKKLRVSVRGPDRVVAGRKFTLAARTSGESPAAYRWRSRACRLATPARARTTVVCARRAKRRTITVSVRLPGVSKPAAVVTKRVAVRPRPGRR